MELSLTQPILIILFFLPLLLSLTFFVRPRRKLPFPPGPNGLPILGNLRIASQLTHRGIAQLGKEYGGLVHLRLGFLHMVSVTTSEFARHLLQTQDITFANRPANTAVKYLTYDRSDMAFAHYGPFWRQMRKLSLLKLFSRKRGESWASVRDEVNSMVQTVTTLTESPVNVGEIVFNYTKNVIYRAGFGSNMKEGQAEFMSILQEFSRLFGTSNIADFFPWLGWADYSGFRKRLTKARESLDRFIQQVIDVHVEKNKNNDSRRDYETDMVDELLEVHTEANDQQNTISVTKDNIKAIIMDVMFGGTETVASGMEWAMAELMRNPEELKKVQEELAEVVGLNRRVQESDIEKLTYLNCAIKETLRLHPPIPLLLHETSENTEVAGYFIPAQSRVVINIWAIGRDKAAWEDPEMFKPSRFLKEGAPDFKGSNFDFLPFGSGRRSCPGMQLGLYTLELGVANLLHSFTWELPDGMKPSEMDISDVFGLTARRATRLVAVPSPRLLGD